MPEAVGWDMYDPRLTVKRPVKALFDDGSTAYVIVLGDCCYIDSNGDIQLSDTNVSKVHGFALKAAVGGDELTLITHGRLRMVTAQTPGNEIRSTKGADGTGSPPSTTGDGSYYGYAIEDYLVFVHVTRESLQNV